MGKRVVNKVWAKGRRLRASFGREKGCEYSLSEGGTSCARFGWGKKRVMSKIRVTGGRSCVRFGSRRRGPPADFNLGKRGQCTKSGWTK